MWFRRYKHAMFLQSSVCPIPKIHVRFWKCGLRGKEAARGRAARGDQPREAMRHPADTHLAHTAGATESLLVHGEFRKIEVKLLSHCVAIHQGS